MSHTGMKPDMEEVELKGLSRYRFRIEDGKLTVRSLKRGVLRREEGNLLRKTPPFRL